MILKMVLSAIDQFNSANAVGRTGIIVTDALCMVPFLGTYNPVMISESFDNLSVRYIIL